MGKTGKRTASGEDAEARILEAARGVLVDEGMDALSMRRVAGRVGVSAPAIYHYFESKRDLVDRLVADAYRKVESYLREAAADCPEGSLDRIRAIEEGYIRFSLEHEQAFRALFALRGDRLREMESHPARGCYRLLNEAVTSAMENGRLARRDPEAVGLYLWSSVHGLVTLSLACKLEVPPGGPTVGALELFRSSWRMMLDGLRPRDEGSGPP